MHNLAMYVFWKIPTKILVGKIPVTSLQRGAVRLVDAAR